MRPMMERMHGQTHSTRRSPDGRAHRPLGLALVMVTILALAGCGGGPASAPPSATSAKVATVHLSPTCNCCTEYVAYLRRNGWTVEVVEELDLAAFQDERGIPTDARGCHTTLIDGYLVDGHVPLAAIERLLDERPDIDGIGLPGMPLGSPGMGEPTGEPLTVVAFRGDEITPFGEY